MSTDFSQAGSDGVTAAPTPPAAGDLAFTPLARITAERIRRAAGPRDADVEYDYEDGEVAALGWVERECGAQMSADAAIAAAARVYMRATVIRTEYSYLEAHAAFAALSAAIDDHWEVQP